MALSSRPSYPSAYNSPFGLRDAPVMAPPKWFFRVAIVLLVVGVGYFAWEWLKPPALPVGIASTNGRIEATEIDIATKIAGRIKEMMADEGDFVTAGQVLVKMDTQVLEAPLFSVSARPLMQLAEPTTLWVRRTSDSHDQRR